MLALVVSNITEALPADEEMPGAPLPPGLTAEDKEAWNQSNAVATSSPPPVANSIPAPVANSSAPPVANSSPPPHPPVNSSAPPPPAVVSGEASGSGEARAAGGGVEGGSHALGGGVVEGLPKAIQEFSVEQVGVWLEGMQLGEFMCQTCLCLYDTTTTILYCILYRM